MEVVDVGPLPTRPSPSPGEKLVLRLAGLPPSKTLGRSMRNVASSQRPRFMALRQAAIEAMGGRKWYEGPIQLELVYKAPDPPSIARGAYADGVSDTLGGSHGPTFVYLPIVYLDDGQICVMRARAETAPIEESEVTITFLQPATEEQGVSRATNGQTG